MTTFTIQVQSQAVQAALQALHQRVGNLQPVLRDVGEGIVQRAKARFSVSKGPDGQVWKPKKHKDGRPTLVGPTGSLRRQIVWSVSGNTLVIRATMAYAAIHQFGGTINRAPYSISVRHRTNAKGQLIRTAGFNGKGLVFAKDGHKRALQRWFEVRAYSVKMPARPFLPVRPGGELYPDEMKAIAAELQAYLAAADTGSKKG